MDADRLATRVASLTTAPSRRRLLAALSAIGLGALLVYPDVDAKRKRNKKKKKNTKSNKKTATVCLNGQALVVPESAVQSLLAQGATLGECASPPSPPPPPPLPPSPPAPPPSCQDVPDLTDCGNGMQCSGGECATPPTCKTFSHGQTCEASGECCSGFCFVVCGPSGVGQSCFIDDDCAAGNCVGFVCR
jgi:hypothetical protein